MPTYVYQCEKCDEEVEAWQSFSDEPLKRHGGCGGKLTKVFQPVGIVLKGSGFYRTDSRNGAKKGRAEKSDSSDSSDSSKSPKSSESKSPGTDGVSKGESTKESKPSTADKAAT